MFWCTVILLSVLLCQSSYGLMRPKYIRPCSMSHDFNKCALENAKYAIPYLLKGDKQFKIPSLLPVKLPMVSLQGASTFNVTIKNVEVYGLDRAIPVNISADFDNMVANLSTVADKITILGDYEINGKILIFPIYGKGPLNITLFNGNYMYTFKWVLEERNGEFYIKITDSDYNYEIENMSLDFKNLFNGDKFLGEQMNQVLNDNWRVLNEDLKKPILKTLLTLVDDISSKIYSQVPFNELFLD